MNIALSLRRSLSTEIFKFRSTFLIWFLLIAPVFIPVINPILFLKRGDEIVSIEKTALSKVI